MTTTTAPTTNLRNVGGNWITGTVEGFLVQAKCFEEPSQYGMAEDGRISKLWVALPGTPRVCLYNFDRGDLDKNHLKDEAVTMIVAAVTKSI